MRLVLVDAEQGSVVSYIAHTLPDHPVYYAALPEGFSRPCIYVPTPDIETYTETLGTFRIVRTLYVHLFGRTIPEAQADAQALLYALARDMFQVPLLNEDGTPEGRWIDIRPPTSRRLDDTDGASLAILTWDSRERYPDGAPAQFTHFDIEPFLKSAPEVSQGPFSLQEGESDGEEDDG